MLRLGVDGKAAAGARCVRGPAARQRAASATTSPALGAEPGAAPHAGARQPPAPSLVVAMAPAEGYLIRLLEPACALDLLVGRRSVAEPLRLPAGSATRGTGGAQTPATPRYSPRPRSAPGYQPACSMPGPAVPGAPAASRRLVLVGLAAALPAALAAPPTGPNCASSSRCGSASCMRSPTRPPSPCTRRPSRLPTLPPGLASGKMEANPRKSF